MKLIDFQNFAGARIDRKINRENGLKEVSPFFVNLPNITVYMPSNPFKMTSSFLNPGSAGASGGMKIDSLTIELLVSIRCNMKLDLIDLSPDPGQKVNLLTPSKINDDEIHFVKFEGRLPPIELSMAALKDREGAAKLT